MQEKENLERSIEELDRQHQEAINELLHMKNQVFNENNILKEKLKQQEEKHFAANPNFLHFDSSLLDENLQMVLNKKIDSTCEISGWENSEKNVDLLTLFRLFSSNCSENALKNQIDWLENQKRLFKVCEENKDNVNSSIRKIDDYIKFLETVCINYESSFPVIKEVSSAFNIFLSHIVKLNQKLKSMPYKEDNLKELNGIQCDKNSLRESSVESAIKSSRIESEVLKCESSSQTRTSEIAANIVEASVQTISPNNSQSEISIQSKHSQTENIDEGSIQLKADMIIAQLKSNINVLEKQNSEFQNELVNLNASVNKSSLSIFVQTDEICQCDALKVELDRVRKSLSDLKQQQHVSQNELSDESDLKEKWQAKEIIILEKETIIQSQKKEIVSLIGRVKNLAEEVKALKSKNCSTEARTVEGSDHRILAQSYLQKNPESNEIANLQEKVTNLELEKGKLLCVLNEKSRECSSLKAEVHKLTSIVASEKQALFKLQQDNCELKLSSKDHSDPELTKEAVKKLSNIIRDKDFEIESLQQKNATLTTLIQDSTNIPNQLQSLLEEKENLFKRVSIYEEEREKFMLKFNTKDKECRKYAAEIKELSSALSEQQQKFDVLEQKHLSIAQQYEEKQKSLINTQNEMIILKQRVSDLEKQQVDIKEQYSQVLNKLNSDGVIQITKDELNDKNSKIEELTVANEEKDHLIQEKDCMILDLSQQVKKLKLESDQQQEAIQNLGKKTSELMEKIAELKSSIEGLESEKQNLEQRFLDKNSESSLLKDMNERLNMALKEKEFAIQSMNEKVSSLSQYINSDNSSSGTMDVNQILSDSESMFSKAQSLYRERDETLLALNQSKQENQHLRNEIQRMKSNEIHLKNELERLRQHLLEIEENYTTEALKAAEKEKRLQDELVEVQRRAEITSTAVVDTSQRASMQIASLQEQLSIIANQRDEALAQISTLEDQVIQHSTAVGKLQLVLEQMQKGNERKLKEVDNKWQQQLDKHRVACKQLEEMLLAKQRQLEESSQALEAASRLSEQLDAKEEIIANLKSELSKFENKIKSTAQEIDSIKSNTEGKVDRVVMKSLVLGYFSTPPGQKSEVIRLLARVLDFNQEEMEKAGIVVGRHTQKEENRGLFSSIFSRLPSLSSQEQQPQRHPQVYFWNVCRWTWSEKVLNEIQ